jgi:hypothetical protein
VSTIFAAIDAPPATAAARARRRFSELELEYALRATAAQQLRVVAAAHARQGVEERRIAALEQAIADRIDRLVRERAAVADRTRDPEPPRTARDALAARRLRAVPTPGRSNVRR